MGVKYLKNITELLGNEEGRYFSNGFKHMDCSYENLCYQNKVFSGDVIVGYKWNEKETRHLHVGTAEYVAIASVICEQMLSAEFYLTPEEITYCWIDYFKTKIQTSVELSENTKIQVLGKLISTKKIDNTNKYKSLFEIKVSTTLIKISAIHPHNGNPDLSLNPLVKIDKSHIYYTGYKMRRHLIENVMLNNKLMLCTASVSIENSYLRKAGISSKYDGTLLTDIILISGQLTQALFYSIQKLDRNTGGNIWVRDIEVSMNEPNERLKYDVELLFTDIKTLEKKDEVWKSIQLISNLGGISLNVKIVTQIFKKSINEKNCNNRCRPTKQDNVDQCHVLYDRL